jgi:citrate lyase subunit beta / citryl-CoA lyase
MMFMLARPRRSVLYISGSNAKALAKASALPADALILDLEDSVAPDQKIAARERVVEAMRAGGFGSREVIIRVNGPHTPWGEDDLAAASTAGPDAILLPKVDGPGAVMVAARMLREAGAPDRTRLWAMMETPNAILNAGSIASVAADPSSRLSVMVMGLNDLAKETRARLTSGRRTMTAWLASCVVAARAHGVDIIDGVFNDIRDLDGFREECLQGRDMGLDGKTLIHPSQIDICNEVFAPTSAEVESAAAIIDAFALPENTGKGVIQLNGRMVELLHADMARRTLAIADAIAARSKAAA